MALEFVKNPEKISSEIDSINISDRKRQKKLCFSGYTTHSLFSKSSSTISKYSFHHLFRDMENEHISEGLDEWIEIQSPSPSNRAQVYKNVHSEIITRDDFFSDSEVFPPSNHEGLLVASPNENQLSEVQHRFYSLSSSSSLSSGGADAKGEGEDGEVKETSASRMTLGLGCLKYRMVAVASRMRNYAVPKARILWLVTSATTGVGALLFVFLLYLRVHRRRTRTKMENIQHLIHLIKEKDQKISELLLQIAQLNDMLLQRRRVPILQLSRVVTFRQYWREYLPGFETSPYLPIAS